MKFKRACKFCGEKFVASRKDNVYCCVGCKAQDHTKKTISAQAITEALPVIIQKISKDHARKKLSAQKIIEAIPGIMEKLTKDITKKLLKERKRQELKMMKTTKNRIAHYHKILNERNWDEKPDLKQKINKQIKEEGDLYKLFQKNFNREYGKLSEL